jgi:hypothetical protein
MCMDPTTLPLNRAVKITNTNMSSKHMWILAILGDRKLEFLSGSLKQIAKEMLKQSIHPFIYRGLLLLPKLLLDNNLLCLLLYKMHCGWILKYQMFIL